MQFIAQSYGTYIRILYTIEMKVDARKKNVAIEHEIRPFSNQGTRGIGRLWTLRTKFNAILEIV